MAKIIKGVLILVIICLLGSVFYKEVKGYYDGYMEEYKGDSSYNGEDVIVEIPEGASAKKIAEILKKKGLIKFETAFTKRLEESEYSGKLKSGIFTLNTGMSTIDMIKTLSPVIEGKEIIDTLLIPEGFTIEQIAARCQAQDICTAEEFLSEVRSVTSVDFEFLGEVPPGADVKYKLQGFLFPATYDIYDDTTAKTLVEWMYTTFESQYNQELRDRATELGYSVYEVITMASIIEREARVASERPTIAGVINNRLKTDMKLQMCPTVLYPLTAGLYDKDQVLYEDLEIDSSYNTYKNLGLPVGPICNPGIDCIKAVLYPEEHVYFYYRVLDEEQGTHVFSETFEEHTDPRIIGGPDSEE